MMLIPIFLNPYHHWIIRQRNQISPYQLHLLLSTRCNYHDPGNLFENHKHTAYVPAAAYLRFQRREIDFIIIAITSFVRISGAKISG